ncbi:MAG: GTP-binding protein [Candidatus Lokiarchaeota archaeon]|nr:GTP-binding protein [Candidatus Lokiarchaeota archaeon]
MKLNKLLNHLKKSRKLIRMTIVGDGAVGKTTLVQAMLEKSNIETKLSDEDAKIEINRTPFIEIEAWRYQDLLIQCYDLAGQREKGKHPADILDDQVFSFIDIYLFVFSLNRYESFENLNNWMKLVNLREPESNGNIGFILVGNKSDLDRNVSDDLIQSVVGSNNHFGKYIETSATKGIGIENLLNEIAKTGKSLLNSN